VRALTDKLKIAGVPEHLHDEALRNLNLAKMRSKGMLWHKIEARVFKAGKIAKKISWGDERLLDVAPELARYDIEPMINITAHGDNSPWGNAGPVPGAWLNQDPESDEYKQAVAANYWCEGEHPRGKKSVKAWYRRNGGAYEAWWRGWTVDPVNKPQEWQGSAGNISVYVLEHSGGWYVESREEYGPLVFCGQYGFEIGNVFAKQNGAWVQNWYPCAGHELRATVTWSTIPRIKGWND